jgi:hypothetical protein
MTAIQAPFRRGGDHHALILCSVLAILLGLAVIMPAPCQAADVPADQLLIGALPPPFRPLTRPFRLCRETGNPVTHYDIRSQEDQDDTETAVVLSQEEYRRLKQGASLTPEEYRQFKKLISRQPATSLQVALVNSASIGTTILIAGFALIALLWVLRQMFNFWFDKDIYDDTWASVAVVVALLLVTGAVIVAAVLR